MSSQTKAVKRDYKQFFALLKSAGQTENRQAIIMGFTDGRTDSLKGLTDTEYLELIRKLKGLVHSQPKVAHTAGPKGQADKMRKKLIWVLCSMGFLKIKGSGEVFHFENQVTRKANMEAINAVIERLGYLKKPLKDYKLSELPKLVTQFENIKKNNWAAEGNAAVKELLK